MGATVGGLLAVHKGKVGLPIGVGVGHGKLQPLTLVVAQLIEGGFRHLIVQQVQQAVVAHVCLAVAHQLQPGVQVGVVPQPLLHELHIEAVLAKNLRVRLEFNVGAVSHLRLRLAVPLGHQRSPLEHRLGALAAPHGHDLEVGGQCVHRLGAHAVQTHGELEHIVVVLGAGVDDGDALHHLPQGNATAVVPNLHPAAGNLYGHLAAIAHDEFVNRVVDDLLQEDVDSVVAVGAIPQPPDVHPGPEPDVLQRAEGLDLGLVVYVFFLLTHRIEYSKNSGCSQVKLLATVSRTSPTNFSSGWDRKSALRIPGHRGRCGTESNPLKTRRTQRQSVW